VRRLNMAEFDAEIVIEDLNATSVEHIALAQQEAEKELDIELQTHPEVKEENGSLPVPKLLNLGASSDISEM
jgi:hypothetical protein